MRNYHKILFGLIMTVMIISPIARVHFSYNNISIMPLNGHIEYATFPEFSWEGWFDGTYQKDYDIYLEDHIGLRNFFVRIHNQIDFSLWKKPCIDGLVVGKDNHLYESGYIRAYLGQSFIGHDAIISKCKMIKDVQDKLDSLGTELIIVMAPGKASMFPEFIPDHFFTEEPGISNNDAYLSCFKEYGIKHIDFNTHFCEMKDTSHHPLYHKCGIHWNTYGAYYALDSIVRYMENVKGIDMADMSYQGLEYSSIPRGTDYDIGDALNLLWRIPEQPMPYHYGYSYATDGKVKPNLMVIADSYYWTIYNLHDSYKLWGEHDFRYYDSQVFTPGVTDKQLSLITMEELKKFDFIMIVYTELNMHVLANKFFEKCYTVMYRSSELENMKQRIMSDPEWLKRIEEKSARKGISVEEQLGLDALWMLTKD